jgi:hypothetical protein
MKNPKNQFKAGLKTRQPQLGIWNTIGGNTVPELLGGAGFDWVLVDCEHAAIETIEVLPALQAIGQHPETSAAVRVAHYCCAFYTNLTTLRRTSSGMRFQTCLGLGDWSCSPASPRWR